MNRFKSFGRNVAKYGLGASAFVPMLAFAQATDPAGAITTELTNVKSSVSDILIVLAGVIGLMILWSYLKKAK